MWKQSRTLTILSKPHLTNTPSTLASASRAWNATLCIHTSLRPRSACRLSQHPLISTPRSAVYPPIHSWVRPGVPSIPASTHQYGPGVPSIPASTHQYGPGVLSIPASTHQYSPGVPFIPASTHQYGPRVPSIPASTHQYGPGVPSIPASVQQHGPGNYTNPHHCSVPEPISHCQAFNSASTPMCNFPAPHEQPQSGQSSFSRVYILIYYNLYSIFHECH